MLVSAIQVISTEFVKTNRASEPVEDSHQDLMGNRQGCLLGPEPRLESMELVAEIGALGAGRAHRRRHQGRLEEHITFARATWTLWRRRQPAGIRAAFAGDLRGARRRRAGG
jgi:hypothetical protein